MEKIASFTINHDTLQKGMYVSRIDGDVITYDIRMKIPNKGDYLSTGGAHTIEHLFATYARNSYLTDRVIYVGPLGCRTGFYLLLRDSVTKKEAMDLVRDSMRFIASFEGEIPGAKRRECGNYLDNDLDEAKKVALDMLDVLKDMGPEDMIYPD